MWDHELINLEKKGLNYFNSPTDKLLSIAEEGLEASFNLGDWTNFSKYIKILEKRNTPDSFKKSFYQAILDIKNHNY
jgi:hypothetical protein